MVASPKKINKLFKKKKEFLTSGINVALGGLTIPY